MFVSSCTYLCAVALLAQGATGELRVMVSDAEGPPVPTTIELTSESDQLLTATEWAQLSAGRVRVSASLRVQADLTNAFGRLK